MSNEPEIYTQRRRRAGRPPRRRRPGPQLGRDPRRHRAPARGALALGRGLRGRVTELTDWRRQVREHRRELIIGAAVVGFAVGGLMASRRRRAARRDGAWRAAHAATGDATAPQSRSGRSVRTPRKPSRPGPTWAPITGPISETKTGSEPKIWRHSSTSRRAVSGSWMCCTTQAPAPASLRSRANSTMRSKARRRVRTRSTGVISSSSVRIGLICSAEPSQACAEPIRPPLRRYSSVSIENHIFSDSRPLLDRGQRLGSPRRPPAAALRGDQGHHPLAAAAAAAVQDVDPLAAGPRVDQRLAGLQRRVVGARDPGRDVDRDDLASLGEQRLVDGR